MYNSPQYQSFTKLCPVGAVMLHADTGAEGQRGGRTDRHDERQRRFLAVCAKASEMCQKSYTPAYVVNYILL